jgi:hypothetical protein
MALLAFTLVAFVFVFLTTRKPVDAFTGNYFSGVGDDNYLEVISSRELTFVLYFFSLSLVCFDL